MQNPTDSTIILQVCHPFPEVYCTLAVAPDHPALQWCKDHLEITFIGLTYWATLTQPRQLTHLLAFFPEFLAHTAQGRFRGVLRKTGPKREAPSFTGAISTYRLQRQGASFTVRVTLKNA
jgi:hypothetical protein